jgi:hypothetical protein
LHLTIYTDAANAIFKRIYNHIGHNWHAFVKLAKSKLETQEEIQFSIFLRFLNKFKLNPPLSDHEKDSLLDSYPGNDKG